MQDYYPPSIQTEKRHQLKINTDANSTLTMQNIQQNIDLQQNSTSSKYTHHLRQLQNQLTGGMSTKSLMGFTINSKPQEETYGIGTFEKNMQSESIS